MSADNIIDNNRGKIKVLAVSALIFSLGFACGYYYLEADKREVAVTVQDKSAECSALFEKSAKIAASPGAVNSPPTGAAAQETAGTVLSDSDTKAVPATEAVSQQFAGSKNSTLYHTRNCQYVKRIKAENVVWFASSAEAETAGKKAHSCVE